MTRANGTGLASLATRLLWVHSAIQRNAAVALSPWINGDR